MSNVVIEVAEYLEVAQEKLISRKETPGETGIHAVLRIDGCVLQYDAATRSISMEGSRVGGVRYADGSAVLMEGHGEPMVGSSLYAGSWDHLRPYFATSGAFQADDSFFGIVQSGPGDGEEGTWLLLGTLANVLVYPDHAVGGYDTTLQADLVKEEGSNASGSRYLDEYFGGPGGETAVFIRSSLLRVTGGFKRDGRTAATVLVVTCRKA